MVGTGIHDGDFLLVRRQEVAEDGDIVVVLLGEEAAVKRFCRVGEAVLLRPENPVVKPIVAWDVWVVGKVVGLIRRLDWGSPERTAGENGGARAAGLSPLPRPLVQAAWPTSGHSPVGGRGQQPRRATAGGCRRGVCAACTTLVGG